VGITNIYGPALMAIVADSVPKEKRGKANGAMDFWSMLTMSGGQIAGRWLYDNVNH
jgi:MFS family permease